MTDRIPEPQVFRVEEKLPAGTDRRTERFDVTVVTVVFNAVKAGRRERFVRCLDSVQAQSGCRIEHLIVDGASQDGTVEIVKEYENRSVPIRWLSEPDRGIYDAMNRGLALARGKYVVYLNSDDRFCNPHGLAASFEALESSGADFSYAPAHVVDENGRRVWHLFEKADEFHNLFSRMAICHQTVLIRRDVMVSSGGFDLAYRSSSDYDLFLRIVCAGCKGVRVEEDFVEFLGGGFSSANQSLSDDEVDRIFQSRLRTDFNSDFPLPVIRRMRETMEYPAGLADRMLVRGEAAFRKKLQAVKLESPVWDEGLKWQFGQALAESLWADFDVRSLPEGGLRRLLHCLRFSFAHPIRALGAVKFGLKHRADGRCQPVEWFKTRCVLMAERLLESSQIALPPASSSKGAALRKSVRGFVCTDAVRLPISRAGERARGEMSILLYACAYHEEEKTLEVRLNDIFLGRLSLRPDTPLLWSPPSIPKSGVGASDDTVEIRLVGGGEFVFGGLCFPRRRLPRLLRMVCTGGRRNHQK